MNNLFCFPNRYKLVKFLLIWGLILSISCQSDSILLDPPNGYIYEQLQLELDTLNSFSLQQDAHTGYSPRLYSGVVNIDDTVTMLINLTPNALESEDICKSTTVVNDLYLELTLVSPLQGIDSLTIDYSSTNDDSELEIKSYIFNYISNDRVIENKVLTSADSSLVFNIVKNMIPNVPIELVDNKMRFNFINSKSDIMESWCNGVNSLAMLVTFISQDISFIEFYSSDSQNNNLVPKIVAEYESDLEVIKSDNLYTINSVIWSDQYLDNSFNPYYIDNVSSNYWGTIYALDINDYQWNNMPISFDSLSMGDFSIYPEVELNSIKLVQVYVQLDSDLLIANNIDTIHFTLSEVFAFRDSNDPSGDNWSDANGNMIWDENEGYEANKIFDWIDSNNNEIVDNLESELWYDYGQDNCPDSLETGNGTCGATVTIYNPAGTEGNGMLDDGENWVDYGIDGCTDEMESGNGQCNGNEGGINDPNFDNYQIDPNSDDWGSGNLDGTEKNNIWDEGEFYLDFGLDGLDSNIVGFSDVFEGNGKYDKGELFYDTGIDGLFNQQEDGYNSSGTEGNGKYDGYNELIDCGIDGICNDNDISDDYNVDPNRDNWLIDSTQAEGNFLLDWDDFDNDGIWDEGEGEEWFDWGFDQAQDSIEVFLSNRVIIPKLYNNDYIYSMEEGFLIQEISIDQDTSSLWISNITSDNSDLIIDISMQSNIPLKGMQFQLMHTPLYSLDTIVQANKISISDNKGGEKLITDLTLLPKKDLSDFKLYSDQILIDYSNDILGILNFNNLDLFLNQDDNIVSHEYSDMILYIDTSLTKIYDDMMIYIVHKNETMIEDTLLTHLIYDGDDSVKVSVGSILQKFQSDDSDLFQGIRIRAGGLGYNYSKLYLKNNAEMNILYTR